MPFQKPFKDTFKLLYSENLRMSEESRYSAENDNWSGGLENGGSDVGGVSVSSNDTIPQISFMEERKMFRASLGIEEDETATPRSSVSFQAHKYLPDYSTVAFTASTDSKSDIFTIGNSNQHHKQEQQQEQQKQQQQQQTQEQTQMNTSEDEEERQRLRRDALRHSVRDVLRDHIPRVNPDPLRIQSTETIWHRPIKDIDEGLSKVPCPLRFLLLLLISLVVCTGIILFLIRDKL